MRGKHRSTPIEDLVLHAESLVQKGVKEIMLIAQDLTFYGLDLYKKRNLSELLRKLSDVEGIEWIRLHYAFPAGFPMDVIDVMKERKNICNYLDIPLQHGSTKILKSMRRGITREKTELLVNTIREKIPDICIRTTLIAGYPGETEEDFQEMYDWVERTRFDRLGIFTYSHEENTHAFKLTDDVPDTIKQSRANKIMELQAGISFEFNELKVGNEYKVIIDREERDHYIGRTQFDSPEVDNEVKILKGKNHLKIGSFVNTTITSADVFDLIGEQLA